MKSPLSISVLRYFETQSLHSREQAQELFDAIIKLVRYNDEVWVDFSDIEFTSRSFADELVHLKLNSKKKTLINFCCASQEVEKMLESVTSTQIKKPFVQNLAIRKFDSMENLYKYLSNI